MIDGCLIMGEDTVYLAISGNIGGRYAAIIWP